MDIWRYPLGSLLEGVPTQPGSDPLMTYDIPVDQKRVVVIPTHSGFGSVPVTNDPADQLLGNGVCGWKSNMSGCSVSPLVNSASCHRPTSRRHFLRGSHNDCGYLIPRTI
jgi:hypothetical protein